MRLLDYKSFEVLASAITVIITQFSTYRACCTLPILPITSKNEQNISKLMKYNEIEHDLCKEFLFSNDNLQCCTRVFRILHPLKKKISSNCLQCIGFHLLVSNRETFHVRVASSFLHNTFSSFLFKFCHEGGIW